VETLELPFAPATDLSTDLAQLLARVAALLNGPAAPALPTFGVGHGKGSTILFNCHYAAHTGRPEYYDRALGQLEQVLQQLDPRTYKSNFGSNYYQELAELGNLLCYLQREGHLDWDGAALLAKIDEVLDERMRYFLARKNLERVNGALSAGTYFLRRVQQSAQARQSLDTLLEALQALREGDKERGYYWTCYVIVEPRVYTGLSHGSGLIMSFLTALYHTGYRAAECAELLHYAARFLLRTRLDPDAYLSSFPLWRGKNDRTNNLCLVYGDLGTTHALVRAAAVLDDAAYRAEAIAIGERTTHRTSLEDTYLHDASVFYGTSGAYLLYDSLHQLTGVPAFGAAAQHWLAQTPTRAQHANEYLGFSSYFFADQPSAQLGLNLGVTGIGLTLLHALSQGRYAFDDFIWLA
jgi:hypothetical protein